MIKMKNFVPESHPLLHQQLKELPLPPSTQDRIELECMMQYLRNSQDPDIAKKYNLRPGSGLSANQIGLNKRMFVARYEDEKQTAHEYKLINPKIISHTAHIIFLPEGEGCLSVNRTVYGRVPRFEKIKIKAIDENGKSLVLSFKGYSSILIQHEIDHMNGIMFYERIDQNNPLLD
ncbi:peptide deformylase [Pullulanibacillus pueri]|nr:peptide deformylase [Pullulanibacillus pueri]